MAEVLTKERFEEMIDLVLNRLNQIEPIREKENRWLKSNDVKKMLGISHGMLQTLRDQNILPYKKLGGIIFYDRYEINKILENSNNK